MQRQLIAARDASNAQIVQLSKQVQHERDARGGDALEHQQTGEHVRAKLEMAEVKIADLANQLRNAQREHAIEKARLEDRLSEALEVGEGARAHAVNARTVLRRQKGRALRERCFVVWKIKAAACVALKKQTMEAAETVKAVKKGYEVQIAKTEKSCVEKVESMRNKLRGRDPRDANKPALDSRAPKGGNKAPRADPWSFLDESTKLEREIAKREREEEKGAETVAMAMAEEHLEDRRVLRQGRGGCAPTQRGSRRSQPGDCHGGAQRLPRVAPAAVAALHAADGGEGAETRRDSFTRTAGIEGRRRGAARLRRGR